MNLAIIISISEYTDEQNNLPGCKKDADTIFNILTKTGKFDEVLYIHEKLSSAKVKERFTDFISVHKSNKIEELFFYYTGHGEFLNDEFYYILSDYKNDKRKQTSLQNEEVDSLFRTLNPEIVVKVIDACQSGKTYIKESGAVTKYFQKTIDRFNKCYFLNSSLKDQSSFQSDAISDFTLSFIKSIKDHDTDEIRYKDIIDFISDEFESNPAQTPFFVVQADYTEKFCVINDSLKDYLKDVDYNGPVLPIVKIGSASLLEKIRKQASEYFTKEQAIQFLNELQQNVETFTVPEELEEIYNVEIIFQDSYEGIINKNTIGKWLDENTHDFFAKSIHTRERKDRHNNLLGNLAAFRIGNTYNDEEYEWVRNGFDLVVDVPYKTMIFTLNSKYPNVESYTARIVYFISKKLIRFFYFISNFETKNWDERKLNTKIEWFTNEYEMHNKQEVLDGLRDIFDKLIEKAESELKEKFNHPDSSKE